MEFLRQQNPENTNALKGGSSHDNCYLLPFIIFPIFFTFFLFAFLHMIYLNCTKSGKKRAEKWEHDRVAKIAEAWEHGAMQAHGQTTPAQATPGGVNPGSVMPVVHRSAGTSSNSGNNHTSSNYVVSGPNGEVLQTAFYNQPEQRFVSNNLITPAVHNTTVTSNSNISPMFLEHQRNLAAQQNRNTPGTNAVCAMPPRALSQHRATAPPVSYGALVNAETAQAQAEAQRRVDEISELQRDEIGRQNGQLNLIEGQAFQHELHPGSGSA